MKEYHDLRRRDLNAAPRQYECRFIDRHGEKRDLLLSVDMIPGASQSILAGVDITESRQAEEAIENERAYLSAVIDNIGEAIVICDAEGRIVRFNETARRLHGLPEEPVPPEQWAEHYDLYYEDGITLLPMEDIPLFRALQGERVLNAEIVVAPKHSGGPYYMICSGQALTDEAGNITGAVIAYRDITERKEYEQALERQRDELEVLNKIVRHDVRNQLQLVLAYGDILTDYVEGDGEKDVQRVLRAGREAVGITQTAGEITEAMLASKTDLAPMKLRPVLESQIENIQEAHQRALVSTEGPLPDAVVLSDEMLDAVFRNLLNNAIVHNDKKPPEITVSAALDDGVVRVRVTDNGPGILSDQKEQIFEKNEKGLNSEGTGLGLYLVQTLVDRYSGDVWAEDNEPEGSVFIVELPRRE